MGHYSFKRSKIINRNLVGVEMKNSLVKMNKPFYLGNAVLELNKFHMYNFHYNVMKPVFNDRIQVALHGHGFFDVRDRVGGSVCRVGSCRGKKGGLTFQISP